MESWQDPDMAAALSYTQLGRPGQTWKSINNLLPGESHYTDQTGCLCLPPDEQLIVIMMSSGSAFS